ncbi:MAG: glycosyltransferase [Candidatus Helarchaeota archaeon]
MIIPVIIPAYNHENTIKDLINSLLMHRYEYKLEIIVVDDKSNDKTPEILSTIKEIKFIRNEKNLGLSASLNVVIQNSTGDFIWIIHGDCIPNKNFLKNAINLFEENKDIGVVCAQADLPIEVWQKYNFYDKVFHFKETIEYNKNRKMKKIFMETRGLCRGMKTAIFRREVLDEIGPFNSNKFRAAGEDGDIEYKIRKIKWKVIKINFPSKHLHAINTTNVKSQFKKIMRLNEAKGTLLRMYGLIAFDNVIKNRYWNPITITIFYLSIIISFIIAVLPNVINSPPFVYFLFVS